MSIVRSALAFAAVSLAAVACDKKPADVPCDSVVAKLMSYQKAAGEPEKKLFASMCKDMDAARKACVMSSSSLADVQAKCGGGKP